MLSRWIPMGDRNQVTVVVEDGERCIAHIEQLAGGAGEAVEPDPKRTIVQIQRVPRAMAGPFSCPEHRFAGR